MLSKGERLGHRSESTEKRYAHLMNEATTKQPKPWLNPLPKD